MFSNHLSAAGVTDSEAFTGFDRHNHILLWWVIVSLLPVFQRNDEADRLHQSFLFLCDILQMTHDFLFISYSDCFAYLEEEGV